MNTSVVENITLEVRKGAYRGRVVLSIVRKIALSVRLTVSFIERFMKDILPSAQKIVRYNFKLVPIIDVNDMTEERLD